MTVEGSILCRDCLAQPTGRRGRRCPECGSPRLVAHRELGGLTIAHMDCDAFYAAVEKRDNPDLAERPVIIGGGARGVVAAACYVARVYGVRSATPMFKALELCPDAVVLPPNITKYAAVGREVRDIMRATTPVIEPLSIDEAFLDLGVADLPPDDSPARALARMVLEIERVIGVTASIGLSYNKFLAKTASDLDKPRGFAVIGRSDAGKFLAEKPVGMIYGVGKALEAKLRRHGIRTIGELREIDEPTLVRRYGAIGRRLHGFARGEDHRAVDPSGQTKSVSSETTFLNDINDPAVLARELMAVCESAARRLHRKGFAGRRVVLKLKTADFRIVTRSRSLDTPIGDARALYDVAVTLLQREADGQAFRLIGAGLEELTDPSAAASGDLLSVAAPKAPTQ